MKWFRLYAEIKDDPKMLELDDHQFRIWINLLAMASQADDRGTLPAHRPRGLAAALRTTPEAMEEALSLFADLGMVRICEGGCITVVNFIERQYDNPSDRPQAVAERKGRMKERAKNAPAPSENTPSAPQDARERRRNEPRTTVERQKNALDTDTDSDTDTEENTPPLPPAGGEVAGGAVSLFVGRFTGKSGGLPPDNIGRYAKALKAFEQRVGRDRYARCLDGFFADVWASEQGFAPSCFLGQSADRWDRTAAPLVPARASPTRRNGAYQPAGTLEEQRQAILAQLRE